jgi:integrase
MAVRKIHNWWWVDLRYRRTRYRKRSPENSQAGAKAYELVLRQTLAQGQSIDNPKPEAVKTFAEFADEWFETYVKTNNKPSEQRAKESTIRVHLKPCFGNLLLGQITSAHIERYKADKLKTGLCPKSINIHLTILGTCMASAIEWGLPATKPKIRRLRVQPPRTDFLDEQETVLLISDRSEPMWNTMILLAARTGMRLGELFGLDWTDVDLERGLITVRTSVVRGIASTPKNHKIRYIPMTSDLIKALRCYRKQKTGLVFYRESGTFLGHRMAENAIHRICRRVGLRLFGWHTLRHTFASHLVSRNAPLRAVQELLGHSTMAMTERYAHLAPSTLRQAIAVLDEPITSELTNFGQPVGNKVENSLSKPIGTFFMERQEIAKQKEKTPLEAMSLPCN